MKKIVSLLMFSMFAFASKIYSSEIYSFEKTSDQIYPHKKDFYQASAEKDSRFLLAFTSGYVFKHGDSQFSGEGNAQFDRGMINVITGDLCYQPWETWGVGAKLSYWRAKGNISLGAFGADSFTILQQVPLTFYLRRQKDFDSGLQIYASLGGGAIWNIYNPDIQGRLRSANAVCELEAGLNYHIRGCFHVTAAYRYLFPKASEAAGCTTVGGSDLRAGISFDF